MFFFSFFLILNHFNNVFTIKNQKHQNKSKQNKNKQRTDQRKKKRDLSDKVIGPILKTKANCIADSFGISESEACEGWLTLYLISENIW